MAEPDNPHPEQQIAEILQHVQEAIQEVADDVEAPNMVEVQPNELGAIIGINGTVIKRLIQATGCQIEVPNRAQQHPNENGRLEVQLLGRGEQRLRAAKAIRDVLAGHDAEDVSSMSEGGMVLTHGLDHYDKQFWLAWRLVPTEFRHTLRADVSRQNVRLSIQYRGTLWGDAAEQVKEEARLAVIEAQALVEIIVRALPEYDTDYANHDGAVSPLIDKHGVLVNVHRPEDNLIPIRIVGPDEAARDAASLLEARFAKGKSTASVLQLNGQVQSMTSQMAGDFEGDLRALEEEFKVKVHTSTSLIYVVGTSDRSVLEARKTIREMLQFYFPEQFHLLWDLKKELVKEFREDPEIRVLTAREDCAVAFDPSEGTVWICGPCNALIQQRLDVIAQKYFAEHWEYDLPDYGAAMWLLGPRGTGEYLEKIQAESGANVRVCPNKLKVWAEGHPLKIQEAERLVMDAMRGLERKKAQEENAVLKPKELLSDVPDHMRAVLAKLAELDEKKRLADNKDRIVQREREWARQQAELDAERWNGQAAAAEGRERSRSRDRAPQNAPLS